MPRILSRLLKITNNALGRLTDHAGVTRRARRQRGEHARHPLRWWAHIWECLDERAQAKDGGVAFDDGGGLLGAVGGGAAGSGFVSGGGETLLFGFWRRGLGEHLCEAWVERVDDVCAELGG